MNKTPYLPELKNICTNFSRENDFNKQPENTIIMIKFLFSTVIAKLVNTFMCQ